MPASATDPDYCIIQLSSYTMLAMAQLHARLDVVVIGTSVKGLKGFQQPTVMHLLHD